MPTNASGKAEQAGDSTSLELVARAGLIAYGVVHLLIGWLAVQIPPDVIRAGAAERVARSSPCWCGSGKKFKKCHGP